MKRDVEFVSLTHAELQDAILTLTRIKPRGNAEVLFTVPSFHRGSSAPSLTETTTGVIVLTQSGARLWLNKWITSSHASKVEPTT